MRNSECSLPEEMGSCLRLREREYTVNFLVFVLTVGLLITMLKITNYLNTFRLTTVCHRYQ